MPNDARQPVLSKIAAADLIKTARTIAGFKITRGEFASTANVSGVRSKTLTFSRRHDSLTAFATNADYRPRQASRCLDRRGQDDSRHVPPRSARSEDSCGRDRRDRDRARDGPDRATCR